MATAIQRLVESPARFMHVVPRRQPPQILGVERYSVKPGTDAAVRNLHRQMALTIVNWDSPCSSVAVESLTGPKEIWRLSGFQSHAEHAQLARLTDSNPVRRAALDRIESQIRALTGSPSTTLTSYLPAPHCGRPWMLGRGHFLVVTSGNGETKGNVYETSAGEWYQFTATRTRKDADARAAAYGENAQVFAIRPMMSVPSAEWALRDPDFWSSSPKPAAFTSQTFWAR